jgi:RNA polymerase sporulation-specific sigma factor
MLLILIQKRWICKEKKNRLFQSVSFSRDARGAGFRAKVTKGTSIGKKGEGDTFIEAAGWTCCKGTRGAVSMQGKVEIAGVNTARLKVLKNEETMALLRRTKEGDQEARRQLIEGNLRLVLSVIQRFSNRGENVDDLFQVGCVGLIKAIDHFDINQPVKFSTYGVPMIVGEVRRYLRDNSAIRVSRSMRDTAYKVLQVRERLMAETQREPTVEQIAKELDIPREDVVFAMDAIVDPVSLYEPVYSDGGDAICVMDQVSDNQNTDESWTDRIALKDAIKRLDERERRILSLRFYEGKTQMEVSAEVGISQAQVSRLEKGAINTIKKNI